MKKYADCGKVNPFREVCRSRSNRSFHDLEQEPDQHHEEDHIDMVNIDSIIFNSKWTVITANLKTSSNQVSIIVPYKVATDSDGNRIPLHLYKRLFPRATKEQFVESKDKNIQLKAYNRIQYLLLCMCTVKIEHNNK